MPNRDYAARSKSQKSGNKLLILMIIVLLLLLSGVALWFLSSKEQPQKNIEVKAVVEHKNELPSKPEEIYSYIRDLETREVPIDKNSKLAQLTKEQEKQILQKQQEEKLKLELQAQQAQAVSPISTQDTVSVSKANTESNATMIVSKRSELTPEQQAEKVAKEKKALEERKQADLKKQELAKKAEKEKQKAQTKIVAVAKPASEAPKSMGKYGLQCGAFKNKAQAENMQARLAMAGYNARINSSADWNRVIVGPIGDRAAASAAQSNARSVAECLIVGM
ncbi:cell division protein FtsN [Vespertiliibacter pulmonis]|uniref:Cell division protein FtsN n=1 Tax=Vespertiliibacter pulmonis TaxID=1443036 RepID=A0A3N4VHY3_9PAST|nr:cell division protein FtsN [Vespertiliibacter pulmonis]QLB20534.1 cell division protein FtsN [Vespertiliibacter pulmonis]RPE82662.1 cell division protein FtsN [Vespertiliibacter pulmonis]